MAESSARAGEKRSQKCTADEKRPPKVRRFDVKVRVPKTETSSAVSTEKGEKKDGHVGTERSIVTTIVTKSDSSSSDTRILATERATEASERLRSVDVGSQELEETKSGNSSKSVVEMPSNSTVPEPMSVNKMLQTSLGLSQPDAGKSLREERGLGYGKNIVDQLFQEFVTTKMREVDDRRNASACEDNADIAQVESEKNQVAESIEEMSRLLDAEITSIKSRNVVAGLTEEDMMLSGFNNSDMIQVGLFSRSAKDSQSMLEVPAVGDVMSSSVSEPSQSSAPSVSVVEAFSEGMDMTATPGESAFKEASGFSGAEGTGVLIRKKPEPKKLGLSIRPESLALIIGSFKNGRALEDGEVASSTDSDGDKAFKKVEEVAEESNDSDEVSGTGSLSDSDRGKEGKAKKKKKKHKHKHKKKKKHKSQSKEKDKLEEEEEKSSHPKERRSSREKRERRASKDEKSERKSSKERKESEDTSKRDSKESKSKDRKKSSHKSKSPEDFDPWDARNYRTDGSRHRSPSPQSSKSRHRDRSRDRHRDRSKDRTREGSKERHHRKHSSHSKEHSRKRSRSKEKEKEKGASGDEAAKDKDLRVKIDKNKLRKIAIARALANMEKGKGPSVDLTLAKSGGKSVAELTEFCKRISQKEMANQSSDSGEMSEEDKSDMEDGPFHHPFITRDLSSAPNIVMNIRNAKQLPVLTPQEKQMQAATLRSQFPVSSGTQHRSKESEWVPVTTTSSTTTTTTPAAAPAKATATATALVPSAASGGMVAAPSVLPTAMAGPVPSLAGTTLLPTPTPALAPAPGPHDESVFPSVQVDMDIGSIVSERIQAMRRLQQNPFDLQALNSVHRMNEQANAWAQSKHLPGQFTGTTDIKILTQEELAGPDKRNQAWAKKDQFRKAPPVQGVGMFLLQKMGWKPGDGLGKDNEGKKEPLMLDVKMDRKGLSTSLDHRPMQPMVRPPPPHFGPGMHQPPPPPPPLPGAGAAGAAPVPQRAKDLSGKHPVSALTELCTKRRWGAPAFEVASETGPAHKRMFLFKVRVNGVEYQPTAACGNKKLAKAQAAAVCLQEMGLIPRDFVVQV